VTNWENLYARVQASAAAAHAVGNRDRERTFLDVLTIMDMIEAGKL
jgi:hypothetical protein